MLPASGWNRPRINRWHKRNRSIRGRGRTRWASSQAMELGQAKRTLLCSGQTSVDANGAPLHAGDMAAQLKQAIGEPRGRLAGRRASSLTDVVRLNYYTTRHRGVHAGCRGRRGSRAWGRRAGAAAVIDAARGRGAVPPRDHGRDRGDGGRIGPVVHNQGCTTTCAGKRDASR